MNKKPLTATQLNRLYHLEMMAIGQYMEKNDINMIDIIADYSDKENLEEYVRLAKDCYLKETLKEKLNEK